MTFKETLKYIGITEAEFKQLSDKRQKKIRTLQQEIHNSKNKLGSSKQSKRESTKATYEKSMNKLEQLKKEFAPKTIVKEDNTEESILTIIPEKTTEETKESSKNKVSIDVDKSGKVNIELSVSPEVKSLNLSFEF